MVIDRVLRDAAVRVGFAFVALLALLAGAATPAAAGGDAGAERMLAAGAGQEFTASIGQQGFHALTCFTDPLDDVIDLDNNNAAQDEPRGDLIEHCVDFAPSGAVTLSVEVETPTDPATDPNWQDSMAGWFIDTDDDNSGEFFARIYVEGGAPQADVQDRSTTPATEACTATQDFTDGVLSIAFTADCIGDPTAIAVSPGYIYDARVESATGVASFDRAPNTEDFEEPTLQAAFSPGGTRIAGPERIQTAVLGSQAVFEDGAAAAVVLTRADNFPDAQAGAPLAILLNAPMLLTGGDALNPAVAEEIQRVLADGGRVFLLGGEAALSAQVQTDVQALGVEVIRYGGANRFETAAIIAEQGLDDPSNVLVANGGDFADSVIAGAASGAAAADGEEVAAVLLTSDGNIPPETQAYLDRVDGETVRAIGGPAAAAFPTGALVGADRFGTSVVVAEEFFPAPVAVGLATGLDFADALTGGAIIGGAGGPGPMLLVAQDELPGVVGDYLTRESATLTTAVIFGGVNAVSADVEDAAVAAIEG